MGGGVDVNSNIFSNRIAKLPFSSIRKIFEEANNLEKKGAPIIHMEIGRPEFDTPSNIKEKTIKALREGLVHYSSSAGIYELREAISYKLKQENGIITSPENGIV